MDCANWYGIAVNDTKKKQALYPTMGRQHINTFGTNKLVYDSEPRYLFKTVNYAYTILGTSVIQIDKFWNEKIIGNVPFGAVVWDAFLPVGGVTYAMITAETAIYVITENGSSVSFDKVTDPNAPANPYFIASFGNRFVVSNKDTTDFYLSQLNLGGTFNPATCFTTNGSPVFNRASGVIGQMGVLHNQLYIFCDYTTDVWANIPSQITVGSSTVQFPWRINSSYNFDYGISDPYSLSIDFGMMVWLANNVSGLQTFMASTGQQPMDISSQAVNVLIENSINPSGLSPFITGPADGFLYQWENSLFYRISAGDYINYGDLDINANAHALEYNFATKTWGRVIELNGERNRIKKHVYFNNTHLVTVSKDGAIYQMAGNIYSNELRTPGTGKQDPDAFTKYPFRYELTTEQIFMEDYSEFLTDYIEIDFVFGQTTSYQSTAPFLNTQFLIAEEAAPDGSPKYLISEQQIGGEDVFLIDEVGNYPTSNDNTYNALYKPHIELLYSDDGGISFLSADVREFSQVGQYQWRMRWYELATSRNRAYRLIAVSVDPIVILGGVQNIRRASGGAN
jgi:hypothetical protein